MNSIELTKQLISIPSFVGENCNEIEIGNFLLNYLKSFPWLKVRKQYVKNGRYNIIAKDNYPTSLLIVGHIDTVQPRTGWLTNQYKPIIKDQKLFGLGASDMKGNLASFLSILSTFRKTEGLMLLLYIDEEYDFLGMKKFIANYAKRLKPKFIISLDGKNLKIGNGCRGLIELTFVIKGTTAHASQPQLGNNAITGSVKAFNKLEIILQKKYKDAILGKTSANLAYLQGGLLLQNKKDTDMLNVGRQGNNIPDIAEIVIDIRPASTTLDAKKIIDLYSAFLKMEKLTVQKTIIRHDFGAWLTPKESLESIKKSIETVTKIWYAKPSSYGYMDVQMLWQALKNTPSLVFGAGNSSSHSSDEYVELKILKRAEKAYQNIIKDFAKGEMRKVL